MSKAVLISIRPEWCKKIINGQKTVEIRKTRPKIETPFKCYLYCTKPNTTDPHEYLEIHTDDKIHKANGKVIAEFICSRILPIKVEYSDVDSAVADNEFPYTGMTDKKIMEYLGNGKYGYGWCVTDLIVYDKPKELSEFHKPSAESVEELLDYNILCGYCVETGRGEHAFSSSPNGPIMCEGRFCEKAYQRYLDDEGFTLYRPPQSWCYVEEIE